MPLTWNVVSALGMEFERHDRSSRWQRRSSVAKLLKRPPRPYPCTKVTRRSVEPMSEPPHFRQADPHKRGRRLAGPPKQASRQSRLAIHDRPRPGETQKTIPRTLSDSGDYDLTVENLAAIKAGHAYVSLGQSPFVQG